MQAGRTEWVAENIRRILAPNPSPMTGHGTNTYLIGQGGGLLLVDPGPDDPVHLAAIMAALAPDETVKAIVVTHAHLDHTALAPALQARTNAPVFAFGGATTGRSPTMTALVAAGLTGGGEGCDMAFQPDHLISEGSTLSGDWGEVQVLHTPGHMGCHISLLHQDRLFSGDQIMGWSTSIVSPPDGDMADYMAQLLRIQALNVSMILPGHGAEIRHPHHRIEELLTHRRAREAQVLAALGTAPGSAETLAQKIYHDVPAALLPAASRNVLAHLIDLEQRKVVRTERGIVPGAIFSLC